METTALIALYVIGAYLVIGIAFLVPFHRWVLPGLDESADGASWGFRIVVSPGLVTLWPVIVRKWLIARREGDPHGSPEAPISSMNIRNSQSLLMKVLAILVPLIVAAAIASRPAPPPPTVAIQSGAESARLSDFSE